MTYDELKALAESGELLRGPRAEESLAAIEAGDPLGRGERRFVYVYDPATRTAWIRSTGPVDRSRLVGLKL